MTCGLIAQVTKELVQLLEARRTGDVSIDALQAHIVNSRAVLNRLLEEDRDLFDETALLKAIENLQTPSDPEKTNEAVQETQIQLANIKELATLAMSLPLSLFFKHDSNSHPTSR